MQCVEELSPEALFDLDEIEALPAFDAPDFMPDLPAIAFTFTEAGTSSATACTYSVTVANENPYDGVFCYAQSPFGLRDVDVYVWEWQGDGPAGLWPGSRVGHIMVTEHDSTTVLLSQFPVPRGAHKPNTKLDYDSTYEAEGGCPDKKFTVHVSDDTAFDAMVANHVARKWWDSRPKGANETHCSRAAYDALKAGGVPLSGQDTGQLLPGNFGGMLEDLMEKNSVKNQWSIRYSK